jgi:hypothetical protein
MKEKISMFLFGAEGINKGDCFTYTYETVLWGLLIWFATLDKKGVPIYVFFILWAILMAWMWGTYFKVRKAEEKEEADAAAK